MKKLGHLATLEKSDMLQPLVKDIIQKSCHNLFISFILFILFHNNINNLCSLLIFINILLKYFNVTCLPLFTTAVVQPISVYNFFVPTTKNVVQITNCLLKRL